MREMIELEPVIYDNTTIPITVSMGATEYTADLTSYDQMILQSDVALYASKAGGRNRLVHRGGKFAGLHFQALV